MSYSSWPDQLTFVGIDSLSDYFDLDIHIGENLKNQMGCHLPNMVGSGV